MSIRSTAVSALALALPAAALAQSSNTVDPTGPSIVAFASGGGASPLSNLNDFGTDDLKTGWTLGGGAGVQLNQFLAVHGLFDFTRNRADATSIAFPRQRFNHYFYGADAQLRYPTGSGFAPYLLAGVGAVTIDNQDDPAFNTFTKLAGKGGVGVEYLFGRHGAGVFAQGTSYFYKFDRGPFDQTQFDLVWTLGLSYRFKA